MKSQDYNKGYIAGLRCAKRYWTSTKYAHKALDEMIAKRKAKAAPRHKIHDMWRHKEERGGEEIYQPMKVVDVGVNADDRCGAILHMSDGQGWTPDELTERGG